MPNYYEVPGLPYPKRPAPLASVADPDDVAALAAGADMTDAERARASAQRTGVPVNYAENRFGTMTPSREVEGRQPVGSVRVNKMNANFDERGQPINPRIGAPGDYSLAKALVPEAVPTLDSIAEQGRTVYGRNETTGQDFEYTPRKSVRPDVAIAIIREARRKALNAEEAGRRKEEFGQRLEIAKVPGQQRIEEARVQAQLDREARAAEENSPYGQERLNDMREERLARGKEREFMQQRRAQQLGPMDERRLMRLERIVETGNPQARAIAQREIDKITGVGQERTGRIGDPSPLESSYGASTLDDENKWRQQLAPDIDAVNRAFDTGWYESSREKMKKKAAIDALRKRAARGQIPPEVVDDIIAQAQARY